MKDGIKDGKWYDALSGQVIEYASYDEQFGYLVGEKDDVKFYIPEKYVEYTMFDEQRIGIELLNPKCMPERHGTDWIDLKVGEEIIMAKDSFKYIKLGVKIALPKGFEAHVLPRSSTFKRWRIMMTNSMGIIDEDYAEEWVFPAYAVRDTMIPMGTRVAQFRLVRKMKDIEFYGTTMEEQDKTRKGLGSTGI